MAAIRRKNRNKKNIYTHEYEFRGKIPHVGVVVFEKEYSYTTKGIEIIEPGTWGRSGVRLRSHEGRTIKTQEQIDQFLGRTEFCGYFYSVLNHNCITFATIFVKFLRGKDITVEMIHNKVNSVINAIPVNYVLHRALGSGSSSSSNSSSKSSTATIAMDSPPTEVVLNYNPQEESSSSQKSNPNQESDTKKSKSSLNVVT